ncbi:MAG: lipopolysaccharide heptosyltransferase I [Candidatus Aminicenantes bacterium]|nr:MAG: lipopolysaccharide heptosyltransferase I [Candidatus Aminicenantes bacterium]
MDNFLIIRLSSLGDIIHTLPAFSALRKNFPEAKISWIVEEKGKEILSLVPGIDKTIIAHTTGWRLNTKKFWAEISNLKKELKNKDRVALDFQGLVKSGFIAFLSKAQKRIGFHRKNLREPLASVFYTERLEEIPEDIHVMRKNLKLLKLIGIDDDKLEFPVVLPVELTETVKSKLRELGHEEGKKLIILNVGAAWETKRWFPDKWVSFIERIRSKEFFLLLVWGNEEERELAIQISEKTHIPLSPPFSLKEVMALAKESSLLVSGDTFALQVACAFSRPVIGIFGPTNPQRNGPFRSQDRVAFHRLSCSYCYKRSCSSLECLKIITPEEVAALTLQSLKENV